MYNNFNRMLKFRYRHICHTFWQA